MQMLELNCIRACEAGASIPQLSMEETHMKSRVLLTSMVLSLTATLAVPCMPRHPNVKQRMATRRRRLCSVEHGLR